MIGKTEAAFTTTNRDAQTITLAQVKQAMREAPAPSGITGYRISHALYDALIAGIDTPNARCPAEAIMFPKFMGIPVEMCSFLDGNDFITDMADGSVVLHSKGRVWRMENPMNDFPYKRLTP
jgi:hypothetical protein